MTDEQKQLAAFYDVSSIDELIEAQEKHIVKLQEKLRALTPVERYFGEKVRS